MIKFLETYRDVFVYFNVKLDAAGEAGPHLTFYNMLEVR